MAGVDRKSFKAFKLARSMNPSGTQQSLPSSAKLPMTIAQLVTCIKELPIGVELSPSTTELEPQSTRLSQDLPQTTTVETARVEVLPGSICPLCLNLGNEVWDPDYRRKYTLGAYREQREPGRRVIGSAEAGCKGCEIVAWILTPYMGWLDWQGNKIRLLFGGGRTFFKNEYFSRILTYRGFGGTSDSRVLEFFVKILPAEHEKESFSDTKDSPCPWRYMKSSHTITEDTGSPAAVKKVKAWYSECLLDHGKCSDKSSSQLPTRVIRMDGPRKARLYTSNDEQAEYACLSHCWGGKSVLQTTKSTIKQYSVGFSWGELPRTFQDAIHFAYSLGFKYLWIDSLCIIQDSVDDWRHEGSLMAQIYTNASITLSATWATNPDQGCFVTTEQQYRSRTKRFVNSDHNIYEVHYHEPLRGLAAPLQGRGWVFQERLLSRRIVHFMEQELWWECRTSFQCECGDHTNGTLGIDKYWDPRERKMHSRPEIQDAWERMVSIYALKSLTYPSDIFPALQGLAKLVPSSMGRYLAGHWEFGLPHSLCWIAYTPAENNLTEWRAPSWSWAAIQGGVSWFKYVVDVGTWTIESCVTVLDATTTPKGDDPMGQLSSGAIVLKGNFLAGKMQQDKTTLERSVRPVSSDSVHCDLFWDRFIQGESVQVVALQLLRVGDRMKPRAHCWLILRAVQGTKDEYERIGVLVSKGSDKRSSESKELDDFHEKEAREGEFKII